MPSPRDRQLYLAKLALRYQWISYEQFREVYQLYQAKKGEVPLLGLFIAKGYLKVDQVLALERQLQSRLQVGNYLLLEKLGEGAMGVVYKAQHISTKKLYAIKILRPELAKEEVLIQRIYREARASSAISHPGVIQCTEVGKWQGTYYLVMEYIEGKSLEEHLKEKKCLEEREALTIALAIAEVLQVTEQRGIVHRDIKPANILLSKRRVCLSDFGLARMRETSPSSLTQTGTLLGTPLYMSPEQAMGKKKLDIKSDVYSLGIVLYEMLTGTPPFVHESPLVVCQKQIYETLPDPRRHRPDLSPAVVKLLYWMTRKRRPLRPSPTQVAQAIQSILKGENPWAEQETVVKEGRIWKEHEKRRHLTSFATISAIGFLLLLPFYFLFWRTSPSKDFPKPSLEETASVPPEWREKWQKALQKQKWKKAFQLLQFISEKPPYPFFEKELFSKLSSAWKSHYISLLSSLSDTYPFYSQDVESVQREINQFLSAIPKEFHKERVKKWRKIQKELDLFVSAFQKKQVELYLKQGAKLLEKPELAEQLTREAKRIWRYYLHWKPKPKGFLSSEFLKFNLSSRKEWHFYWEKFWESLFCLVNIELFPWEFPDSPSSLEELWQQGERVLHWFLSPERAFLWEHFFPNFPSLLHLFQKLLELEKNVRAKWSQLKPLFPKKEFSLPLSQWKHLTPFIEFHLKFYYHFGQYQSLCQQVYSHFSKKLLSLEEIHQYRKKFQDQIAQWEKDFSTLRKYHESFLATGNQKKFNILFTLWTALRYKLFLVPSMYNYHWLAPRENLPSLKAQIEQAVQAIAKKSFPAMLLGVMFPNYSNLYNLQRQLHSFLSLKVIKYYSFSFHSFYEDLFSLYFLLQFSLHIVPNVTTVDLAHKEHRNRFFRVLIGMQYLLRQFEIAKNVSLPEGRAVFFFHRYLFHIAYFLKKRFEVIAPKDKEVFTYQGDFSPKDLIFYFFLHPISSGQVELEDCLVFASRQWQFFFQKDFHFTTLFQNQKRYSFSIQSKPSGKIFIQTFSHQRKEFTPPKAPWVLHCQVKGKDWTFFFPGLSPLRFILQKEMKIFFLFRLEDIEKVRLTLAVSAREMAKVLQKMADHFEQIY